jgi:hypothetical protein
MEVIWGTTTGYGRSLWIHPVRMAMENKNDIIDLLIL